MFKLTSGRSSKNSITFSSKKTVATAIRKEDGEIEIQNIVEEANKKEDILILLLSIIIISLIKSFILIPLIKKDVINVLFYLIPAIIYTCCAIYAIIAVRCKEGINLLKNHAAEHMVHLAYKSLKRIPSKEEVKHFSRINPSCGINIYSAFITAQLIGFFTFIYTDFVIPEIILFILPCFMHSYFPFNLLGKLAQFWTTSPADDENIELALAALKALEMREQISNIVSVIFDSITKKEE